MVAEVYKGGPPAIGAGIWGVANEYDLASGFDVNDVVKAMIFLQAAEQALGITTEDTLPITSPVSFGKGGDSLPPGIKAIQELKQAVEASSSLGSEFWASRFVASVNPPGGVF